MTVQLQKKLILGTCSLALLFAYSPQNAFANATPISLPAQSQVIDASMIKIDASSIIKAEQCTPALSITQLSFKEFIKSFSLKSIPKKTLTQAEKEYQQYQAEIKAKEDKKASQTFERLMKLLEPFQDIKTVQIKMTPSTNASYTITPNK